MATLPTSSQYRLSVMEGILIDGMKGFFDEARLQVLAGWFAECVAGWACPSQDKNEQAPRQKNETRLQPTR